MMQQFLQEVVAKKVTDPDSWHLPYAIIIVVKMNGTTRFKQTKLNNSTNLIAPRDGSLSNDKSTGCLSAQNTVLLILSD